MRIAKLNVFGFKSFRNSTVIHFDKGITGIVGPNGCGKSNIVDAILWVCGSGSASQLRGQQMGDIIFAGTEKNSPSSLAEVSLTFEKEDSQHWPEGFESLSEIVVTRKLKRGSDSQYFLNGEPCLLRNIQEIMMNVGALGFSIVEQGTVSQMVSYKPHQLRELIDQVAGTSLFKNKRRLAQNKFKNTQQNILRVGDIVQEQNKQLTRLERQSRQAQEYKKLKEKLNQIETQTLKQNYLKINKELEQKNQKMNEILKTETSSQTSLNSLEEKCDKFKKESQELYSRLEGQRKDVAQAFEKLTQCEMEIQTLKVSMDSSSGYSHQLNSDISYFKDFQTKKEKEMDQLKVQIGQDQNQLIRLNQEIENKKAQFEKIQIQQNLIEREKVNRNQELEQELKKEIQFQESLKSLQKDEKRLQDFIQSTKEELKKKENQCKSSQNSCKKIETWVSEYEKGHLNLQEEIRSQKENIFDVESLKNKKEQEFKDLSVSLVQKKSTRETFISLKEKIESPTSGYEWLKKEKSYPVLYDMVEMDPDYKKAVQAVLNQYLYSFVVENLNEVETLLKEIQEKSLSRVRFVFSSKSSTSFSLFKQSKPKSFDCFLREKISLKKGFEKYNSLLDLLFKDVVVVNSLKQQHSLLTCVTLQGDLIVAGCMASGGSSSLETLDVFKEIDVLQNQIEVLTQQKEELTNQKNKLNKRLENLNVKKEELVQKQSFQTQSFKEKKKEHEYLEKQISFFKEEIQSLYTKLKTQEKDFENCLQKQKQSQNYISKSSSVKNSLNSVLEDFKRNTEHRDKMSLSVSHLDIQIQSLNKDLKIRKNQLQILHQSIGEIDQKKKEFLNKLNQNKDQVSQNLSKIKSLEENQKQDKKSYHDQVQKQEKFEELYQEKLQSYQELETQILESKTQVQVYSNQKHEIETRIQVLQSERKNLEEKAMENFELNLKTLSLEELKVKESDEKEDLNLLRNRLSRIGQVNLLALREYEDLCEENQKLQDQLNDLNQSKIDLEKIIQEMDHVSNKKFKQAFEEVNTNLQKVFSAVFSGGRACLTLNEEEGIEILVSPPGKKLKNLTLLSGGEKSLTALCMILALFLVRPAPFCVLDEVDAALDDQNVVRFNSLMLEMAKKCQVLLVTHNKYSMRECHRLYGVTMEEKGITQLLSVEMKQDEATLS